MELEHFTSLYEYRYDPPWDKWRIPKVKGGKFYGDCEDFSLGVLYYVVANESHFKFWKLLLSKAKMHYVLNNGAGHAVLQLDGMYIDNWTKAWVDRQHMESLGHEFHQWKYLNVQVVIKMLYAKIRGVF